MLIADDHADTRIILRHYLEAFGLHVDEAVNGVEALEELRRNGAGVLVLDVQMPQVDGISVLEQVRSDERLAGIPVVVLTGDAEGVQRARDAGADECLTKPAHPRALYDVVTELISDRSR